MRYPGEVWFLPPESRVGGDIKWRRHVLLLSCEDDEDVATLAYASTSDVEAVFGGSSVLVDPTRSPRCGFSAPTYVAPCRLVVAASEDLERLAGRLSRDMAALRRALRRALGIGRGQESLRGRIVELGEELTAKAGFRVGVIVTEPAYSLARRFQLIVPLLDAAEYLPKPGDVIVTGEKWLDHTRIGILAVDLVQTAYHPTEVARTPGRVVDETPWRGSTKLWCTCSDFTDRSGLTLVAAPLGGAAASRIAHFVQEGENEPTGRLTMTSEQHEKAAHRLLELADQAADFEEATYLATSAAAHASLAVLAELQAARIKSTGETEPAPGA